MKQFLKALAFTFVAFLIVLSLAFVGTLTYIAKRAPIDNKIPSDVIIILGTRTHSNETVNPCVLASVNHGADLYKKGYGKKIILSGGYNPDDKRIEALEMKTLTLNAGVKEEDILIDEASTTTYENLLFSQKLMVANGLDRAIIITDPHHSPRADLVADKVGFTHTVSPAPNNPCWGNFSLSWYPLLRDTAALLDYKIQGKL